MMVSANQGGKQGKVSQYTIMKQTLRACLLKAGPLMIQHARWHHPQPLDKQYQFADAPCVHGQAHLHLGAVKIIYPHSRAVEWCAICQLALWRASHRDSDSAVWGLQIPVEPQGQQGLQFRALVSCRLMQRLLFRGHTFNAQYRTSWSDICCSRCQIAPGE